MSLLSNYINPADNNIYTPDQSKNPKYILKEQTKVDLFTGAFSNFSKELQNLILSQDPNMTSVSTILAHCNPDLFIKALVHDYFDKLTNLGTGIRWNNSIYTPDFLTLNMLKFYTIINSKSDDATKLWNDMAVSFESQQSSLIKLCYIEKSKLEIKGFNPRQPVESNDLGFSSTEQQCKILNPEPFEKKANGQPVECQYCGVEYEWNKTPCILSCEHLLEASVLAFFFGLTPNSKLAKGVDNDQIYAFFKIMGCYYWSCERCNQIKADVQGKITKHDDYIAAKKSDPLTCTIFVSYNGPNNMFKPSDFAIKSWATRVCDDKKQSTKLCKVGPKAHNVWFAKNCNNSNKQTTIDELIKNMYVKVQLLCDNLNTWKQLTFDNNLGNMCYYGLARWSVLDLKLGENLEQKKDTIQFGGELGEDDEDDDGGGEGAFGFEEEAEDENEKNTPEEWSVEYLNTFFAKSITEPNFLYNNLFQLIDFADQFNRNFDEMVLLLFSNLETSGGTAYNSPEYIDVSKSCLNSFYTFINYYRIAVIIRDYYTNSEVYRNKYIEGCINKTHEDYMSVYGGNVTAEQAVNDYYGSYQAMVTNLNENFVQTVVNIMSIADPISNEYRKSSIIEGNTIYFIVYFYKTITYADDIFMFCIGLNTRVTLIGKCDFSYLGRAPTEDDYNGGVRCYVTCIQFDNNPDNINQIAIPSIDLMPTEEIYTINEIMPNLDQSLLLNIGEYYKFAESQGINMSGVPSSSVVLHEVDEIRRSSRSKSPTQFYKPEDYRKGGKHTRKDKKRFTHKGNRKLRKNKRHHTRKHVNVKHKKRTHKKLYIKK